jgi:hypothetical protein
MTLEYRSPKLLFAGILGIAIGGCNGSGNGVAGTGGTTGGVQPFSASKRQKQKVHSLYNRHEPQRPALAWLRRPATNFGILLE